MSKHTPEPWSIGTSRITSLNICAIDLYGNKAIVASPNFNFSNHHENALRIVTCVNACAGMADPAAEIAELKRQRDELIDEFDQIMKFYDVDSVSGLIRAQEGHILRLQESAAKKSMTRITVSSPVRSA